MLVKGVTIRVCSETLTNALTRDRAAMVGNQASTWAAVVGSGQVSDGRSARNPAGPKGPNAFTAVGLGGGLTGGG